MNHLYLGFHNIREQAEGDHYHTALILIPKIPDQHSMASILGIFNSKTVFTINRPVWELRCA
jgi:hypothetical protein